MRVPSFPLSVLVALLPLIALSDAQDQGGGGDSGSGGNSSYLQDLSQALQSAGFTQLANVTSSLNATSAGQQLLTQLSDGNNYTVFAPTDDALRNVSSETLSNQTLLAEIISYHIVHGNFLNSSATNSSGGASGGEGQSSSMTSSSSASSTDAGGGGGGSQSTTADTATPTTSDTATPTPSTSSLFERLFGRADSDSGGGDPQLDSGIWPNVTLGRTLLNSSEFVQLEGNKSQVLAWTRSGEDGNVTILNQSSNVTSSQNITVVNSTSWNNLFINGISGVLIPPGNLTTALTAVNDTPLAGVLESVQVLGSSGSNESVTQFLQEANGITIFAPNTEAFTSDVNSTLQQLQNNQSAILALLQNHYVNGTTLYSSAIDELASGSNSSSGSQSTILSAAGEPLQFTKNDTGLFVQSTNGSAAQIIRPDVLLDNGVMHIIDRVFVVETSDPAAASSAYESATSAAAVSTTETGPVGVGAIPATTTQASSVESSSSSSSAESSSSSSSSSESSASQTAPSSDTSSSAVETGGGSPTLARFATNSGVGLLAYTPALVGTIIGTLVVIV